MRCFVYGTLTDPDTAGGLLDSFTYDGRATVNGLHRVNGTYPTLLPGGAAMGRILVTPETEAIDRYEGVVSGLYVRVTLPCDDGDTIETYVGDPDRLGVDDEWPGNGPFDDRVRAYLDANDVRVAIDAV